MHIKFTPALLFCALCLCLFFSFRGKDKWQSRLVGLGRDGSLHYTPDEKGNVIPDFSLVGYEAGRKPIPDVRVARTLSPATTGSSQELIQSAIDELSGRPVGPDGFRGAILLKKGT